MTRRAAGALALLLLVAGACGDDDDVSVASDDPTTTTTATTVTTTTRPDDGQPRILVASGSSVDRVVGGAVEHVGDVDGTARIAFGAGEGIFVEVDDTLVSLLDGAPMQLDPGAPGQVILYDAALVGDVPSALYGVRDAPPDGEPSGSLFLAPITGDDRRDLGSAFAVEFFTATASIGGDLLVTSAYTDLTESVDISPLGGGERLPWSPAADLAYNEPPLIIAAVLAPDGATIAWLSGPDTSGSSGDPEPVGSWEVVVADVDGDELHRIPLDAAPEPVHLDYDGERLLVSRDAGAAVLIDLATGERHDLPVPGLATFET